MIDYSNVGQKPEIIEKIYSSEMSVNFHSTVWDHKLKDADVKSRL